MSDPLSVASSAVGIISLGLQVCGEIVSFCQAWRGFNEDIQNIAEKADGLRMPLRTLRQLIEDFRTIDPTIASDLENKAMSIERAIKRLKTATDRYASTTSDTDSFRFQLKKAAYPFKKQGLRDMAGDLDSVQAVLQTALQIYTVQSTRAILGKVTQEMQEMNLKLRDLPKLPPSLLQSWCAQQEQLPALRSSLQIATQGDHIIKNTSIEQNRDETCSDSCRTKTTHRKSIACQNHNPANNGCTSCPRPPRKETEVIRLSYSYCSRILSFAIRASFLINKGAGGYSIAPWVHLQPLLDMKDSVGYSIIDNLWFDGYFQCEKLDDFELLVGHTLQQLQCAFDLQEATPFDLIWHYGEEASLFDIFFNYFPIWIPRGRLEQSSRLLNFLLDSGSKPNINRSISDIRDGFEMFREGYSLGWCLLDIGYSFTIRAPNSPADRQGMRHLLSRSDEPIQITDIVRIILQESEDGLRDALNSGKASPNDMIDDTSSMVDYAFGWPKGIQILLEAGATPSADNGRLPYVIDNANEDTYHSVKLLLEAGWLFSWADIYVSQTTKGSRKIKSLLINELVARRKTLWNLAQSCLPSGQLPKLISDDEKTGTTTIFDIHTAGIHDCLVKQGISINPILSRNCSKHVHCVSVYHYPFFTVETLDELYQVGFRGVTQLDWEGFMPLMIAMHNDFWSSRTDSRRRRKGMERISWLISKGADPYQKVPGTSATAAHHLGLEIVDHFLDNFHRFIVIGLDKRKQYEVWKQMVSDLAKDVFLLPSIWDGCGCACSPSGCTTMSVLLRHIVRSFSIHEFEEPSFWFRELIQFLLWWTKGDTETGWGVIRFLTFDALGLKHSCCIKNHTNYEYPHFKLESREEEEVAEILDEQKPRLMELEKLLDELKIKFDELGHPVMEFLEGYWHTRMIEVLSQRDPYDQEHIIESRRIGVTLEPDECVVPDRVSLLIGSKIMYEIST